MIMASPKLLIPTDARVNTPTTTPKQLQEVLASDKILDAGPETIADLKKLSPAHNLSSGMDRLGIMKKDFRSRP